MDDYACAIVVRSDLLLLGLRSPHRRRAAGHWDIIGGRVERGEEIAAALARELSEEIGVTPTAIRLLGVIAAPTSGNLPPARYHLHAVSDWTGGEPAMRGEEHTELRWFTLADACREPLLALAAYSAYFEMALAKGPGEVASPLKWRSSGRRR